MLSESELRREAAATGFQAEALEKVIRLLELMEALRSHPYLKNRIALKGGTALNLFVFDVPRLSVDIDLNYVGALDRETMLVERPKVAQALEAVCSRSGIQIKHAPAEHAGGKWRLSYSRTNGRAGNLEIDINFLLRRPLWTPILADSKPIGSHQARAIPMLDPHELAAGKLSALFERNASRDLFDVRELLGASGLDLRKVRLGFIVYGGMKRRDWREVSIEDVGATPADVERRLLPLLRGSVKPKVAEVQSWTERLVEDCRRLLSALLPLSKSEVDFFDHLNERGEILPDLLTEAPDLQSIIASHPGLRWKARNVRKHQGLEEDLDR